MAIKSRLLVKLKLTYETMNMVATSHPQKMHFVYRNLVEARELCQQGLTEVNYAKYGEVYDGLIMAVKQITSGDTGKDAGEIVELCKELLEHIMVETGKEEHFKKEMVFLPYKASMWDSLESVWRAAYEDKENCLAYVIPIPYCDRNPDGTAKEWHCERDLFPKDVPTLDWQEVDLKTMHPDVIFYHYPYDNCNRVTSQDEAYYSSNLKECADKLVYIPYFVLPEIKFDYEDAEKADEVREEEDKLGNVILEPGVTNADLVIVQSEAIKTIYVNVLSRYTNAPREYWEKHILGLGSPKFDKAINSQKNVFELPDEWEKIIGDRKTVLYNTGLTTMLKYTDKYIEKVRLVLKEFKCQKNLVLWWRPHPLLRATLCSMHPELLTEYDDIVNSYRKEGWGIFDETADLDRAIAYTDAYYGDWSSVQQLYRKIDKPVVEQEVGYDIPEVDFVETLYLTDGMWEGNTLYFPAWNVNGMFSFDVSKEKTELLRFFPAKLDIKFLFCRLEKVNQKLYFIPTNEDFILIFDMEKEAWEKVYIDDGKLGDSNARFTDAYRFGNTIWLKPYFSHAIVSYSIDDGELIYYSDWYKELEPYIDEDDNSPKFGVGSKSDNAFYFPFVQANKIVEFDVCSRKHRIMSIGNDDECILNVRYHDKKLYCYTTHDDLLIYSLGTKEISRKNGIFHQLVEAVGMVVKNGFMWIFACRKDMYAKISISDLSTEIVKDYCDGNDIGYPNPVISGDVIYLYPNQAAYMFAVNTISNDVKKITVPMPKEYEIEWEKKIVERFPLREKNEMTLLKKMIKRHEDELKDEDVKNNAGDDIYKEVLCHLQTGRSV